MMIVKSDLDVVKNRHILEQTDVLECSRDTCFVDLDRFSERTFLLKQARRCRLIQDHNFMEFARCFTISPFWYLYKKAEVNFKLPLLFFLLLRVFILCLILQKIFEILLHLLFLFLIMLVLLNLIYFYVHLTML